MRIITVLLTLMFLSNYSVKAKEKVVYKYKKRQRVDLGDLEIKGKILAPGDITVSERERKRFRRDLYDRRDFDEIIRLNVLNMR